MLQRILISALFLTFTLTNISQTPCEDGFAGIYPCENVDLLSMLPASEVGGGSMNDIWGWIDPEDGTEYVLLCRSSGVSFIDISDAANPVYLGNLPTHTTNSTWRDVKVYNNHAFVVSEAGGHGMQVFDLSQLSGVQNPPVTFEEDAHYDLFGGAHNIAIDTSAGFAYAVGTNTFSGGLHIVDIQDPLNPQIAGDFAEDGYTHDAQIITYSGPDSSHTGSEIAFACNENSLTIIDCNDKNDCVQLSRSEYEGSAYAHQGWLSEDQRFFFLGDEVDELNFGHTTKTLIWNVEDLENPVLVGSHFADTDAIDHNQYVKGNLLFQSNYRAGLRILETSDAENGNLNEVAFFDVYPENDNTGFQGSWSNYPYFESGVIAVTHIGEGLFLVKPRFLQLSADTATICPLDSLVVGGSLLEGFEGPVELSASGLPEGAQIEFSDQNLMPPTSFSFTISGLPQGDTTSIHILAEGEFFDYSDSLVVITQQLLTFYSDDDADGFGSPFQSVEACAAPDGYVANNDDCNDGNPDVYPGAPGTMENIDNDCSGNVSGDELEFCAGDFDDNLVVNSADLLILLGEFGCQTGCTADLNSSGDVNTNDMLIFLSLFSTDCN